MRLDGISKPAAENRKHAWNHYFDKAPWILSTIMIGFMISIPRIGRADETVPEVEIPPGYEEAPEADHAADAEDGEGMADPAFTDLDDEIKDYLIKLENQLRPQYNKALKIELDYIQRICKPTKEQHQNIIKAGNHSLNKAVRRHAIAQSKKMRGNQGGHVIIMEGVGGNLIALNTSTENIRNLVQIELAHTIQEFFHPEQAQLYQEEINKQFEHIKRASILNIVVAIDQHLALSSEQRDWLVKSLSSNWQEDWAQSLQILMNNNQYLPMIPDKDVVPILTANQKRIWQSTTKQRHMALPRMIRLVRPVVIAAEEEKPADAEGPDREQAKADQDEEDD